MIKSLITKTVICCAMIIMVLHVSAFAEAVRVVSDGPLVLNNVGVLVPRQLAMTYWIRSVKSTSTNPYDGDSADVTQEGMNFGELTFETKDDMNIFTASKYFTVFIIPESTGLPYTITQSCTGVVNGSDNLNYSLIMTPDFNGGDCFEASDGTCTPQIDHMPTDSYGPKALAVGANRLIWDAPSGVDRQIIRCYYGITTGSTAEIALGAKVLTADTSSGEYKGTITFSMVVN